MITDRYYYNHLSKDEKEIYTVLYKGVTALKKEIFYPKVLTGEIVHRVFNAVTQDNPHLYYLNPTHMDVGVISHGAVLMPQYFCTKEQIEIYNGRIQACINQIVKDLDLLNCSEIEKEKRIHDYMCLNISYDDEALNTTKVNRLVAAHSIIGVFAKQRAVCDGIAKATKLLLNAVDVGCIVVNGKASFVQEGPHAWNIVKVDGNAYHLDVTWDMSSSNNGFVSYEYFNVPDVEILRDHFEYLNVSVCTATQANYFTQKGLYFGSYVQLENYLKKEIKKGKLIFQFKMADESHTMEEIVTAAQQYLGSEFNRKGKRVKIRSSYGDVTRIGRIRIELLQ